MEERKHYRIKLDGSESEELSMLQMAKKETNTEKVSIMVSKRMLRRMKNFTEIQNNVSDNAIVYSYIKHTLTLLND